MTPDQAARVIELLEGITLRLDAYWTLAMQPDEPEGCQHPDEKRVSLSTPWDRDHWVCAVCRFDNKSPAKES